MYSKTAIKDYKAQIDMSHPADGMYYEDGQFWDEDKGPRPTKEAQGFIIF